jgi:hypothetical protein
MRVVKPLKGAPKPEGKAQPKRDAQVSSNLSFERIKAKQREIRSGFPEPLGLRIHRAISWMGRAEAEPDDHDVQFILLWISFNAAYAAELGADSFSERDAFASYFDQLCKADATGRIYGIVWQRFPNEIRLLLENQYVFSPFWKNRNGDQHFDDWEDRLSASKRTILRAMGAKDTTTILQMLFDRLYVLRNQLVHGGSTWNSSVNRNQVRDGAAILGALVPTFIDLMMDNPTEDWGRPYYPVVE